MELLCKRSGVEGSSIPKEKNKKEATPFDDIQW
jgi:hypothetical protein